MKIENALVQIDFNDYIVTIYDDSARSAYNPARHKLVVSDEYRYSLENKIEQYCDNNFLPNLGDEIHVVSGCPIPCQDLRNNYKLKREFDDGVCNVFSNTGKYSFRKIYATFLFNAEHRLLIASTKNNSKGISYSQKLDNCAGVVPKEYKNLEFKFYDCVIDLCFYAESNHYLDLLMHTNKKPCIVHSKLKMNRNEVTIDIINMVHMACTNKSSTKESLDNAILVLSTLSQYNWKDYPMTMSFLFNILEYHSWNVYYYMHKRVNYMPKAIREILSTDHYSFDNPTEKDWNMCRKFIDNLLGIYDTMFVSIKNMEEKIDKCGIPKYLFDKLYDTTVRIVPKKTWEESK